MCWAEDIGDTFNPDKKRLGFNQGRHLPNFSIYITKSEFEPCHIVS